MKNLFLTAAIVLAMLFSACSIQEYEAPQPQITPQGASQQPQPVEEPPTAAISPVVKDKFSSVDKPHWGHMPVTYSVLNEKECGAYEVARIERAFGDIINATNNVVSFMKVNSSAAADISLSCTFVENCYRKSVEVYSDYSVRYETICGHQLGVTSKTTLGDIITKADIELFGLAGFAETKSEGPSGFYVGTCGHTITEVHELLHAFGYQHSTDNTSIMYPEADSFSLITQKEGACEGSSRQIDNSIVEDLVQTYSGSNQKH